MDETLTAWVFLFIIFFLWVLGFCLRSKSIWAQWYTWLIILFGSLQLRSLIDIVRFDLKPLGFPMDPLKAMDQLRQVNTDLHGGLNETDIQGLYMGTRLSKLTSAVPILSTVAFCVVAIHVLCLHCANARRPEEDRPGAAVHWLLAILAMPATLAVMALRAWMRTVLLMTGSGFQSLGKPCPPGSNGGFGPGILKTCGYTFNEVSQLEYHTSETDLAVAMACQYFAVFCFALLCIHYFPRYQKIEGPRGAIGDYIFALKTVGFIGLWLYATIGFAQSVFNIILTFGTDLGWDTSAAQGLKDAFEKFMPLSTILCVINMIFILKIRDLTEERHLGSKANMKFIGTRVLLLAGTLQPKILNFILAVKDVSTGRSALMVMMDKCFGPNKFPNITHTLDHAGKSEYQIQLWNSSLLCFFCVLVALANLCFWTSMPSKPHHVLVEAELELGEASEERQRAKEALAAPLLGNDAPPVTASKGC